MHQPDEWDTVSGEPQNFYEDNSQTATVEDGWVAKQALEDIAGVERYASVAAPVQAEQAQAEPVTGWKVERRDDDAFGVDIKAIKVSNPVAGFSVLRSNGLAPHETVLYQYFDAYLSALPAQAEQVAAVRAAALTEASEAIRTVIWNIENDNGLRDEIYGAERCRDAVAALATKEAAAQVPSNDTSALGDTGGDHD
jgi:hypothetical protein